MIAAFFLMRPWHLQLGRCKSATKPDGGSETKPVVRWDGSQGAGYAYGT